MNTLDSYENMHKCNYMQMSKSVQTLARRPLIHTISLTQEFLITSDWCRLSNYLCTYAYKLSNVWVLIARWWWGCGDGGGGGGCQRLQSRCKTFISLGDVLCSGWKDESLPVSGGNWRSVLSARNAIGDVFPREPSFPSALFLFPSFSVPITHFTPTYSFLCFCCDIML